MESGTPQKIGPYTIDRELGRGGMGVVYLGTDTRLDRKVAIKALPAHLAQDPERLSRFEREAKTLATVSHPNVAGIYGVEEQGGQKYLVLEYVEGENLAERLDRGALDVADALDLAVQIAAGVEAAHDAGIIHRDLKPANVIVTPEGQAKVLDFGLARVDDGASSSELSGAFADPSNSPTLTADAQNSPTMPGVILGTAAYMSPEQARGRKVDKRTDIWSFGVMLYEMLSGIGPFQGETATDSIGAVLHKDPDFTRLPASTPAGVRHVLSRCLMKDRKRRLRDIGDVRLELEEPAGGEWLDSAGAGRGSGWLSNPLRVALLGLFLAAVSAAAGIVIWRAVNPAPEAKAVRFEIQEDETQGVTGDPTNMALSPDGTMLVFKEDTQEGRLYLRELDALESRVLEGTENAAAPFWSPDGEHIAFFDLALSKLKTVSLRNEPVVTVCDVASGRGGTWSENGVILFADAEGPIYRVKATGGRPEPITTLDTASGENAHRFPHFLPDGRRFFYSSLPPHDGLFDIYLGELGSTRRDLVTSASSGVLYRNGNVIYQRDQSLVTLKFDGASLPLEGEAVIDREPLRSTGFAGGPGFSMSEDGTLAFSTFKLQNARLVWVNLDGREVEPVPIDPAPYAGFEISHDGRHLALVRTTGPNTSEIWLGDLERGVVNRLSDETMVCEAPFWSPDDAEVAYVIENRGPQALVVRELRNPTEGEILLDSDPVYKRFYGWTPDGSALVYGRQDAETVWDLWLLPLTGDREPQLFLRTPFSETTAQVSPDGRWIVYASNESGATEVYVQPFPDGGVRYQVTKGGGGAGTWLDGGRELVYVDADGNIMAADVMPGQEFRLGAARRFATLPEDFLDARLSPDGKRILALLPTGAPVRNSIAIRTPDARP